MSESGRIAPEAANPATLGFQRPTMSGGSPPAMATFVFWSMPLVEKYLTKMRSCEALNSSTIVIIARPSRPVHFSQ